MFRLTTMLLACSVLAGCSVSKELMAEIEAKKRARLEAAKIPEVQLTSGQREAIITKLSGWNARSEIVWERAGTQKDGKIFACAVLSGKDVFGVKHISLGTGTFEPDGSFARSGLLGSADGIAECNDRGFEPPVRVKTTYTVVRY